MNMQCFRISGFSKMLIVAVVISVVLFQISPPLAYSQTVPDDELVTEQPVRVAFLGIDFEGVPDSQQETIINRLTSIFELYDQLEMIGSDEIAEHIHADQQLDQWIQQSDDQAYRELAEQLNADYLYWGMLENPRGDDRETLLDGSLYRYDYHSENSYSINVLKEYDNFREDAERFQQHLVETVIPEEIQAEEDDDRRWPVYVITGLALGGIAAFAISVYQGGSGSTGTSNGNGNGEI